MILCINQSGPPILACQNALVSVLGYDKAINAQNGVYGRNMAADINYFRTAILGVPAVADGLMLDQGTIDALERYMNQDNRAKLGAALTSDPDIRYDAPMFNAGDEGGPILAAQNALVSVLGKENADNAQNGSYGSNTSHDVAEFCDRKYIPVVCDGRMIAYVTWQCLLDYMSQSNRTKTTQPLRVDVPAMQAVFSRGVSGPPIAAMQAALKSLLGQKAINEGNGAYGSKTAADLKALRGGRANLTPVGDGSSCPKVLWDYLYSYMNEAYQEMARQPLDKPPPAPVSGDTIAKSATAAWNKLSDIWVYHQYRPMADSLWDDFAEDHSDCSSFATLSYKDAGAPDPNNRGYDGYGYTGTLWPNSSTCSPRNGALAFYGGHSGNDTTHVAVVVDGGANVITFGSTPISKKSLRYRSDYRECRWPHSMA